MCAVAHRGRRTRDSSTAWLNNCVQSPSVRKLAEQTKCCGEKLDCTTKSPCSSPAIFVLSRRISAWYPRVPPPGHGWNLVSHVELDMFSPSSHQSSDWFHRGPRRGSQTVATQKRLPQQLLFALVYTNLGWMALDPT